MCGSAAKENSAHFTLDDPALTDNIAGLPLAAISFAS
jgi:hypothetical protein